MVEYNANSNRYLKMHYKACGNSGLKLPRIALGLWYNFGVPDDYENCKRVVEQAFDLGITYFDLANNYGPPPGTAEMCFGRILKNLASYRDEIIVSSKAGFFMWDGPYGEGTSKKHLIASLDQSLKRLDIDYVDIFYLHRFDEATPLEEISDALLTILNQGKALYIGLSNFDVDQTKMALKAFKEVSLHSIVHQSRYSMLDRHIENGLLDLVDRDGLGFVAYSVLEQGLLTDRYLERIPQDSRAARAIGSFKPHMITETVICKLRKIEEIADKRGQSVAQMAISWVLRDSRVTTALIGASRVQQVQENVAAQDQTGFSDDEIVQIEDLLK